MSEEEKGLLDEEKEYPDCPGCETAHLQRGHSGPPFIILIHLSFVILANGLPISVLYPFLYLMVRDFHIAEEEDIGYYAGYLGSAFMVGRFLTAVMWGFIADKYGRKLVMFVGITSVIVFNTLFGLSTNFWMALAMRFLLGTCNGLLAVVKAYASEICTQDHQTTSVAVVTTVWGVALVIGPAMGGILAQPAKQYPRLFSNESLFGRFPYLLQALFVTAFAIAGLLSAMQLPETLHKHHDDDINTSKQKKTDCLLRNWPFWASTLIYCIGNVHDIAYTEVFSLWALSSKRYGGLDLSSSAVGIVLAASGFGMLTSQLVLLPVVAKVLGPVLLTRTAAALTFPLLFVYPFMSNLQGSWLWVVLLTASVLKYMLLAAAVTGSVILINNSVTQDHRAIAHSYSLCMVSLFKAVGPIAGGSIFAWTQKRLDACILPGNELIFFFLGALMLLMAMGTFKPFLPPSLNTRSAT